MSSFTSSSISDNMERLSSKSGVLATLAMDRMTSSVLQFKGNMPSILMTPASSVSAAAGRTPTTAKTASGTATIGSAAVDSGPGSDPSAEDGINGFARMIWEYVNSTGQLVQDMDSEDDLKLLRLRTKKHEFVIVPDSKFIFVVVHDVKST